jgi:hypothetical protein
MIDLMKISEFASHFEKLATKKSEKKKLDPKAKVRNRGKVIFPAERSKDKKDRYPINNIDEARAALRYAGKQKSAPWFNGTLEEMKKKVEREVHKAFPSLKHEKK